MDIKKLLLNPITFAAAGGFAAHRFLGKKEPMWAPIGGAAVGAILGWYLQKSTTPAPVPQVADKETPPAVSDYVDFSALPASTQTHLRETADPVPDATPEDSMGSYEGGLGEQGEVDDDIIDQMLAEAAAERR
jgi:hypothetical protein